MFNNQGYQKVEFQDGADVYVINTCSVTDQADKKCKKIVQQALRHNPEAYIAIVGCYAQLKPEEIANIKGVDVVLGASEKFNIVEHIEDKKRNSTKISASEVKHVNSFTPAYSEGDRTRTFLKVQDGCDYFCSFCTIPLARGFSRSDTIENTIKAVKELSQKNIKEVVLTGVNIGDFGTKNKESFLNLIQEIETVDGIERFRISSIEPNLLTKEIIELVHSSKKFMPHFHIPLQSGSNKILKLMRRRYQRELYAEKVAYIKSLMPNCCIGVDVIVGFPHETDEDFLDTYQFLNQLDVSYLHVFTYSERENTTAIRMSDIVPMNKRNERSRMLHTLSDKKKRFFYENQLWSIVNVLFEQENDGGYMYGFSENYVKVKTLYDPLLVNEIVPYKIKNIDSEGIAEGYVFLESPVKI